ncbi:MAG: 4-coumarate--CoA ligase family protein [SAR324 cluster bacterium]|nr:4-coumarate--CoA ligase family protein [SAR324 cluster bacterium]
MIFSSPSPNIEVPEIPFTDYVMRRAGEFADKPAMIDGPSGRTLTYGELARDIKRVAAGLAQRDFGKGDVFAIYSSNLPEYAVIFQAVATVGGINTTINPLYTAGELAKQLNDSGARFLITVPPFLEKAREAAAKSGIEEIFVFGEAQGATPFADLLAAGGDPPAVKIDPREDLIALPYSSGTTGLPKGVMLTHHNLVANLCQVEGMQGFTGMDEHSSVLAVLPFFHIYGLVVIMCYGLANGSTIVTMPRFDMEEFLGTAQKYGITILPIVPPIVLGLVKHPAVDKFDLSKVSLIFCGAAPLGESLAREAGERLSCPVVQGYGMTEASPVTHLSAYADGQYSPGSIGKVIPNTEVKIVEIGTGKELGPNQEGELWIRGPQIMKGYLNRPQDTAEAIDADGWYHSGDVGLAREDGQFFIVDRVKELIKYKGMQVAPAELEAILLTHPAVMDAAVIPSPDEEAGEVPKAFVVLKGEATPEEIMSFVAEQVAPHKRIRRLEFVGEIPKSPSGKILRRLLIDKERAAGAAG